MTRSSRSLSRSRSIFAVVALAAAACSESSSDPAPSTSETDEVPVRTSAVTLNAGEEKYLCWAYDVPEAFSMSGVDIELPPGIHHYQLTSEGAGEVRTSPYDCAAMGGPPAGAGGAPPTAADDDVGRPGTGAPPGAGGGAPSMLSVGGPETPGVHFPPGTAMRFERGTRIVMQLHLLNASTAPREYGVATAHLRKVNGQGLQPVGVLLVNDDNVDIPANAQGVNAGTNCAPPEAMENIFMVWPHMHLLGKEVSVAIGDQTLVSKPWDFDNQGLHPVKTSATTADAIKIRCRYDNPTGNHVKFGMGTNDEMCSAFIYYYPSRTGGGFCGSEGGR